LLAVAKTYGQAHVACSGPVLKKAQKEGSRFRLYFDFADGLSVRGGEPRCFYLAGADGNFRNAKAAIETNTMVVSCDSVPDPAFVRFAFTDTDSVNLFNGAGLPAVPFRTDSIPLLVRDVKIDIRADSLDNKRHLVLSCYDSACRIVFSLDGSAPGPGSPVYHRPLPLDSSVKIRARAYKGNIPSAIASESVYRKHLGQDHALTTVFPYSHNYTGGKNALLDGIRGSDKYYDGHWQGYQGVDFDGVVDLGTGYPVDSVSVSMLQDAGSWIFLPLGVEIWTSEDGVNFSKVEAVPSPLPDPPVEPYTRTWAWKRNVAGSADTAGQTAARYIRIHAKNIGRCPKGHPGAGDKAWLFLDEIIIN
jgi:hypothetical protein